VPVVRRLTVGLVVALAALVVPTAADADEPTTTVPTTTAPPTTSTSAPPPPPRTSLPLTGPELRNGSTGIDVAFLQIRLRERGFWLSEQLGRFGESTRNAVVAFQKFHGLPRTGRVDFWTRLGIAASAERATPRTARSGRAIEVDLARQVMIIQTDGRVDVVINVSTGTRATPTPKGTFRLQRQIKGKRVSRLGTLFSPKYFTGGYAVHGSTSVPAYPASHGCVRVTNQAIDYLWASGLLALGTPITIA
jgi:peptidoglycan hydrolase-like protein with peptidoglycan-binding domain